MRPPSSLAPLLTLALLVPALAAGATRTLALEHPADAAVAVENLAGTMRVLPGDGDRLVAIATVQADSEELAAAVRFEVVRGEDGVPALRVRYPLDAIRYPAMAGGGESHFSWLGGLTSTGYDGHRVKVSGRSGPTLYADLEVRLPRRPVEVRLRNVVGKIAAEDVQGKLVFDTGSGDVRLARLSGEVSADTGSGDVSAEAIEGSLDIDTGSGDCAVAGLRGGRLSVDTGSGDVSLSDTVADEIGIDTGSGDVLIAGARVGRLHADTGSGEVRATEVDAEEFAADTGSGDVVLEAKGERLGRVTIDTGSGDVRLRLGPEASFEAMADLGSGDVLSGYADAESIRRKREIVGYRRRDGRTAIRVGTGHGDLRIEP